MTTTAQHSENLHALIATVALFDSVTADALTAAFLDYQRAALDLREQILADGERLARHCQELQAELDRRALTTVLQVRPYSTTH